MTIGRALETKVVEKPWGRGDLPPPFVAPEGQRIGEIWFDPPAELPELLVKYLFTSENLSVQVHPSDKQAPPGSRGKEECWLVLSAEPGARLAVGFQEEISAEQMRSAALDGSIENLLEWYEVSAGDFIYLTAGTVHAIGAGLSLIEVQQNSDITYRLYDYGRPRELHLEEGIAVAQGRPHPDNLRRHLSERGASQLVDGPHFRLDMLDGSPDSATAARYAGKPLLVIPVGAKVGIGDVTIESGGCGLAGSISDIRIDAGARALIAQPF